MHGASRTAHELRERRLAEIARRQHSLLSLEQFAAAGLGGVAVRSRVARGRLHRVIPGVYSFLPPPFSIRQRWMAAVLACGEGAALCGPSSAALQDIAEVAAAAIHVRSPTRSGRRRPGIRVSRGSIDSRDLRIIDGIRAVSADVVLIDLAPSLAEPELETVLVVAESKGLLKRARLGELIVERRGRPGIPKLESLLALEPAIVRSDPEALMLPIARMAGVERPKVNFPISVPGLEKPLIVDYAWPEIRMVVEADSQRFHGDWERAKADRERDQLLALAGWRCHRFTRDQFDAPRWMAARLASLAALSASSASS